MSYRVKVDEYHPALDFGNGNATVTLEFWQWAQTRNMKFGDWKISTPMKHFESSQFKHDFMVVVFTFKHRNDALCFALAKPWSHCRVWA